MTGAVKVEPLDVDDDAQVAAAHEARVAAARAGRPWAKVPSLRELTVELRKPTPSERLEPYVGIVDGEVAGLAMLWFPLLDNTKFTWFDLHVHPRLQRRGVGGALLEHMVERTREDGRATVLTEFAVPDDDRNTHGYTRFVERHGMTYANTEIRRILDLPVDPARLEELAAGAAPHHEGYSVEWYRAPLPEHLRQSYCDAYNTLAVDAPTGEVEFEEESLNPQTYVEDMALLEAQGRTMLHTVAVHPTDQVVAYNDLVLSADDPDEVMQWGTLVRREHRGHRLGMAVKVRGLQELAKVAPQAKRIQTTNAEQNAQMVAVNVEVGFRKVEAVVAYQRHVAG
jgi:GNAT superfamily N-acetyltransferase